MVICESHPDVEVDRHWGCPDCLYEIKRELSQTKARLRSVEEAAKVLFSDEFNWGYVSDEFALCVYCGRDVPFHGETVHSVTCPYANLEDVLNYKGDKNA